MKPKHQGGYPNEYAVLCERTLVTLMRGLGPYKSAVYLVGGLVPRYLVPQTTPDIEPHVGTTDVDIVLDFPLLADTEAYRSLEANLKAMGFERGVNDEGKPQHFRWVKELRPRLTLAIDLLCDQDAALPGRAVKVPDEKRLSALHIPGARLASKNFRPVEITAELLDDKGVATETVQVAEVVAFIVLKALAYDDRFEEKDAYDLVYTLLNYQDGPLSVGQALQAFLETATDEDRKLVQQALAILRSRFATDSRTTGDRKDGPTSYARFLTDVAAPELDAVNRRQAHEVVEAFLLALN